MRPVLIQFSTFVIQVHYRHDKIKEVAHGDKVRINNTEDTIMAPLSPTTILSRAEASVGFGHNTYSARSNNCEHKATDVRYARPVSLQATYWEELCKAVLFVVVLCLGSVIYRLLRQVIDLLYKP